MVGELVGQRDEELILPNLPGPFLFFSQRGKGAVVEVDVAAHLIVAVFAHDIQRRTGHAGRMQLCVGLQDYSAVELAEKLLRYLVGNLICQLIEMF